MLENGKKNIFYGFIFQFLSFVLGFIIRKPLLEVVGLYLLGVNGVFENIISMLSLVNFGIGSASMYYLYRSFSKENSQDIVGYYNSFVKLFKYVAVIILLIGITIIFKIDLFVDTTQADIIYLRILFSIHLIKCVTMFLITCPRYALICDEKKFYSLKADIIAVLIFTALRAYSLIQYGSLIIYIALSCLETWFSAIYIYICFKKQYKHINFKINDNTNLYTKDIMSYAKHLAIGNINYFVFNCTDNIVLSKICGAVSVGLMSNYYLIVNAVNGFANQFFSSIESTAIKRIILADSIEKEKTTYETTMLISYVIGTFISFFLYGLIDLFIKLFFGVEYYAGANISFFFAINSLLFIIISPSSEVIDAKGLNAKTVIFSAIMTIANISFSIMFAKKVGPYGILLGTIIARIIMVIGQDLVLSKYVFFSLKYCISVRLLFLIPMIMGLFIISNFIPETGTYLTWIILGIKIGIIWLLFQIPFTKRIIAILKTVVNK